VCTYVSGLTYFIGDFQFQHLNQPEFSLKEDKKKDE